MATETTGYEVLDQYRNITSKLKKRFLRKPNETEASESFATLGQQCESQDLPQYAALSWTAAARCEGTLGNAVNETSYLLCSARQFLKAEEENVNIGCTSVSTEHLQAGLLNYTHASRRYGEDCLIPIGLDLEIADFLKRMGRTEYLETYLENVVQLSDGTQDIHLHCLELLASYFVSSGEYVLALNTFQEITKLLETLPRNGQRCEMLLKCEVTSVFLLLILRPSPQNIASNLAKILEKYTWGDHNDSSLQTCRMSEKLFLLMQSLVIICQSLDTSSLEDIESEFWEFLSTEQKDLLRILVKLYYP